MTKQPIDCEQALKQVFEFIDHELDEHNHEAMQAHLESCRSCFSRIEFEQRLKRKIAELRESKATPAVSDKIKSLIKSF